VLRAESGSYRPMNLPLRSPMLTFSMNAAQVASAQAAAAQAATAARAQVAAAQAAAAQVATAARAEAPTCGMRPDQIV
jgi:hypothetical protein